MIFVETPTLSSSRSPWQHKNEASIYRTAKEFAIDRKRVREWRQSATLTAHWKDKPAVYTVANLCQSILTIKFLGLGGPGQQTMSTSRRGTGRGAYSQDKMLDPTYKPPLRFRLALRLQNGGRICGKLRYWNRYRGIDRYRVLLCGHVA